MQAYTRKGFFSHPGLLGSLPTLPLDSANALKLALLLLLPNPSLLFSSSAIRWPSCD